MKYNIGDSVFIFSNPLHMDVMENNPIIDGTIESININTNITSDKTTKTISYEVNTLMFFKTLNESEIFDTYESAGVFGKSEIRQLIKTRQSTIKKMQIAFSCIDGERAIYE